MKRATLSLLLLGAALGLRGQAPGLPARPEQLPPKPALTFAPPTLVRETLPNGMRLILLEDHTLPLVNIRALIKVGSIYEPGDKVGLAELTGACLATGGTASHPANSLTETLESLAAELDSSIGQEDGTVNLNLLSRDLDAGLPLFAEILMKPSFSQDKLEVERTKMLEALRRQNDEPFAIADRESRKALYGEGSPWARTPAIRGVQGLTRADVAAFHSRFFQPAAIILAVAGDFDSKVVVGRLAELFRGWKGTGTDYPKVLPSPASTSGGVLLMDRPDLTQTTLLVGELCGSRHVEGAFNTDRYAMDVMNYILGGGGFNSVLMREIRSNRGLAYGAGSYFTFGTDRGVFQAYCQTGPETTGQVISIMRDAFQKAITAAPPEEDLRMAKESLVNKFVFNFQDPAQIVNQAATQEMRGFPRDYMARYCENIRKVTAEDVRRVAAKYLHPDRQNVFVLGPAKDLEEPLKAFGKVEVKQVPAP